MIRSIKVENRDRHLFFICSSLKNRCLSLFSCLALILAFPVLPACAETIILKSGKKIVGEILNETEEGVVVSKGGGGFVYSVERARISEIRQSTPEEVEIEIGTDTFSSAKDEEKKVSVPISPESYSGQKKLLMERYERQVEAAKKARGRIKIKFKEGRFGVVEATLNEKVKVDLLVDTGASLVVITRKTATALGIENLEEKGKIHVVLADGSIRSAIPVTLKSVQVGHSRATNIKAAVSDSPPGGNIEGLLGMSYLDKFHVKMDKKEKCLILEKY